MADPFLGQITIVGFNFPPRNYATCDGQTIQISQNQPLFALLGTQFGGDGRTNFRLPDLRGRSPIHPGQIGSYYYQQGQYGGYESVALQTNQMGAHTHDLYASPEPGEAQKGANNTSYAQSKESEKAYVAPGNGVAMNTGTCTSTGGGEPHYNMAPSSVINFIIALQGTFPSRN